MGTFTSEGVLAACFSALLARNSEASKRPSGGQILRLLCCQVSVPPTKEGVKASGQETCSSELSILTTGDRVENMAWVCLRYAKASAADLQRHSVQCV
eukprot:3224177-Pyramimonas_sp.AAC.2